MKYILLIFAFVFTTSAISSQSFIVELKYGSTFAHNTIEVEFLKVISDSRCPKKIQCIRAGEAKVLVAVYKKR